MTEVLRSRSSILVGCMLILAMTLLHGASPAFNSEKQESVTQRAPQKSGQEYRKLFTLIQRSLASGNIAALAQYLAPQVQVNLRGAESGYYSANQAYYLLENYFRSRKVVAFEFSTVGESDSSPYATGGANFNFKGSREYAQVYVSLSREGQQWVITQINIY